VRKWTTVIGDEDLKQHYRQLLAACDEAMKQLATLIKAGYLDIK